MAANGRTVTVFGGTGFLGRRIVRHLRDRECLVRIASRHPDRGRSQLGPDDPQLRFVQADIHDERSVAEALAGADAAVNTVSLYVEHGQETFHSVHVESAQRVAAQALRAGVERLVHVSGIGADPASRSRYIRARGEGERVVRAAFADAQIIRPAVMFGPDDAFLTTLVTLLRRLPIYPMFDRGAMKLQPAYVDDVAEATVRIIQRAETQPSIFECGGPRVYSYAELVGLVARQAGLTPILIPIPLAIWHVLARVSEILPSPPLTRNQVELMQIDTVSSPEMPGFAELGISPQPVEAVLQEMVSRCG
ncbi:complex I NDUFA9 subunit family protein [Bradyrhizobium erythrophlei]|uniref:complex I NDUFA9 subunit family protein n=1 Tax=Bradyrhizobium erythrophlei TaxID=1437360 RepID=UPI0035EC1988